MHDNIKGFHRRGNLVPDNDPIKDKENLINDLEVEMRDNGFVPVLDLEPQFTRTYNPDKELFEFVLTIYGVKEKDAWQVAGISNGKMLRSTTPIKSSLS